MIWLNLLIAAGAVQGLALSALLLFMAWRRRNHALRWLAAFIGVFSLLVANDVLFATGAMLDAPHVYQLVDFSVLWLGPLCYGYVCLMLGQAAWSKRRTFLHFLPGLLLFALIFPELLRSVDQKRQEIRELTYAAATDRASPDVAGIVIGLIALAYLLAALWRMRRYSQTLEDQFSNTERYRLDWLTILLSFCALVWVIWMLGTVIPNRYTDLAAQLALGVGVYALGYRGLSQPRLWMADAEIQGDIALLHPAQADMANPAAQTELATLQGPSIGANASMHSAHTLASIAPVMSEPEGTQADKPKYAKTGVSQQTLAEIGVKLQAVMDSELLFLEPELSLGGLAARLQISPHTLSQTLNAHFQQSFFEYVNTFRVAEVERCFADTAYQSQSILEIALASGFASKATFNATFKRLTGQTPSERRAQSGLKTPNEYAQH